MLLAIEVGSVGEVDLAVFEVRKGRQWEQARTCDQI